MLFLLKKINQDGQEYNSVFLKDGTKIVYPDQNPNNEASVYASETQVVVAARVNLAITHHNYSIHSSSNNQTNQLRTDTVIKGFNGGTVFGTENKDKYSIVGCENMTIDVSQNDGQKDYVTLFDNGLFPFVKSENKYNTVIHRKEDKIFDGHLGMNKKNKHINVDD